MKFVITDLSIDDVRVVHSRHHPEATPVGPFDSREEAWEYARAVQAKYGTGGGSVTVAPLIDPIAPEVLA